ncbi:DNA gyrase inhibitor YacG [Phenylobacterium sp.]|uniref:DNA gyrase inhibitor YacG n=1 Tax=Phenylobacterium sp. TaxID=1871053 RepID=UPI0027332381|nr:DNA gyrase inhibitor YacG [Phenylobacterium sp.]MDP3854409.1 DNA gyrase inhibitor YacG [Phenylobacterium sp.]
MSACPVCGKPAQPDYRPFCSKRCADVDLHRWLKGGYAIPVVDDDEGPDSEDPED